MKKEIPFNRIISGNQRNKSFSGIEIYQYDDFRIKNVIQESGICISSYTDSTQNDEKTFSCSCHKIENFMSLQILESYFVFTEYDMGFELSNLVCDQTGKKRKLISRDAISILSGDQQDLLLDSNVNSIENLYSTSVSGGGSSFQELVDLVSKVDGKMRIAWAVDRNKKENNGYYKDMDSDYIPYYIEQERIRKEVVQENVISEKIKYIAGVDVAYNEQEQRMVGAIVVLNTQTLEVVDQAIHEMDITFPYIPGLFSFREIPPILEAFKKLTIKPDLIVCDAHGIAHPKGVGMATHLGVELDIPTIGCAKKRLVGYYNKEELGEERGAMQDMIWASEKVGVALRTQDNVKPMFVSIGHKIDLDTAIEWVLKLCTKYRLPETTRQADQLVNKVMKERTEINFLDD
jgi:deoxyribonuclease V